MLCYCEKCGRILQNNWGDENYKCDCCKSIMLSVPSKYLLEGFDIAFKDKETENLLIEELVKTSPEFDQYLFEHRDEIIAKQSAEFNAKMAHGKALLEGQGGGVKCTYCGSTNVKKISLLSRAHSIEFWWLGSAKIGKQFQCKNCGAYF